MDLQAQYGDLPPSAVQPATAARQPKPQKRPRHEEEEQGGEDQDLEGFVVPDSEVEMDYSEEEEEADSDDEEEGEAQPVNRPPHPPAAPLGRPPGPSAVCRYGQACYRKNPIHFQEFLHPWLDKK